MVEQLPFKQLVAGSSPAGRTLFVLAGDNYAIRK